MKKLIVAVLALFSVQAMAQAPTGTFTVTPTSGTGSVNAALSWSITGAASCTASGGWTGAKPASGTQAVTATATTTYTLNCVGTAITGEALASWNAVTQNTDGSAITDLASYRLYRGSSSSAINTLVATIPAPSTSHTVTGLSTGTHWFSVSAVNASGTESGRSASASKVVAGGQSASFSATVTVSKIPAAPGGFTVTSVTAYEVGRRGALRIVGTVERGATCLPETYRDGRYMAVNADSVRVNRNYRGGQLVAKCARNRA